MAEQYDASVPLPEQFSEYLKVLRRHGSSPTLSGASTVRLTVTASDEYTLATNIRDLQEDLAAWGVTEGISRPTLRRNPNPYPVPPGPKGGGVRERVIALNDAFFAWRSAQTSSDSPLLGWEMLNDLLADLSTLAQMLDSELSILRSSANLLAAGAPAGAEGCAEEGLGADGSDEEGLRDRPEPQGASVSF